MLKNDCEDKRKERNIRSENVIAKKKGGHFGQVRQKCKCEIARQISDEKRGRKGRSEEKERGDNRKRRRKMILGRDRFSRGILGKMETYMRLQ